MIWCLKKYVLIGAPQFRFERVYLLKKNALCFCLLVVVHSAASNNHHCLRCETYTCFGLPLERLNMKESVRV